MSATFLERFIVGVLLALSLATWLEPSRAQVPACSDVFPGPITEETSTTLDLPPFPEPNDGDAEWENDLTLPGGTYYFEDLDIDNGVVVTLGGPVLIFVESGVDIGNNAVINVPGDPANFVLISYDEIAIGNNAALNGLLYAQNDIDLGNNVNITGAVTSEEEVDTKQNTSVSYDPEAVENADFGGLCSNGLPPAELEAEWRMDEVEWSGTNGEVIDSSGNNNGTARTAGGSGSLPSTVPGKVCNAGRFRGQGFNRPDGSYVDAQHYIDVPHNPGLSPLADVGGMSIGGWFRLDSTGGRILHKGEGGNSQEYRLSVGGGQLTFTLWNRYGSASTMSINPESLSTDTWYFFTVTAWRLPGSNDIETRGYLYDASGQIGDVSEQTLTVDYTNKVTNARLFFAAENFGDAPVNFLDGRLDEIRIYSGIQDADGVEAHWSTTRDCPGTTELLLEYRMEQSGWDGTPAEVLDTSGNDRNATSVGGADTSGSDPAIAGNPGSCRYGELDGNNGGIVDASASDYLNGLSAITVMGWVYNTDSLAGNNRGIFFTNSPTNNDNRLGLRYDTDGFFGGGQNLIKASVFTDDCDPNQECHQVETVSNVMVQDQWQHIAMTWRSGETIRVYVDGSEVGISNIEGPGANGTLAGIDRLDIGLGATNERWQGRIDEFRIFQGALDAPAIQQEMMKTFPCEQAAPDHIRLLHPGSGLTCSPSEITVQACANSDCSNLLSDEVQVGFLSPTGNWGPDPVTFTGQTNVTLQVTSPGTVTLDAASDPAATNPTRCFVGTAETCELEIFDAGFRIEVPDHMADTSVTGTVAAIKGDPADPQQCVPGFQDEEKDVELWSGYLNPGSGTTQVAINGSAIPNGSPGSLQTLSFDIDGVSPIEVRYPDVGRMQLNARYEGTDQEAGLVMTGNDHFTTRPAAFDLAIPGNPAATGPGDEAFIASGVDFEIEVEALNASGNVTPNFGRENQPESVDLITELVAPAGGEEPDITGSFGEFGLDCDGNPAAPGTACGKFNWTEVGIIKLTPQLAEVGGNRAYLDTEAVVGSAVDHVGRFIPHHFEISGGEIIDRAGLEALTECSSDFTYVGERFDARFTVIARNLGGGTTLNYEADFAFLAANQLGLEEAGGPDLNVDGRSIAWVLGSGDAVVQLSIDRGSFDGPFEPYEITSQPVDQDGVALLNPPASIDSTDLYFGRLVVDNAIGSELGDLALPWRAEYWDGSTWRIRDDNCTVIDLQDQVMLTSETGVSSSGNETINVGGGISNVTPDSVLTLSGGLGRFMFSAPGSSGWIQLELLLDDPAAAYPMPFLRDDLEDDDNVFEENPNARATFGLFDGNSQRIYIREIAPR
ncbi:DUF6701 domain-containing protein [Wenzhouxiangella sp. EGI_FJ10409]|uniref:DUF6701 domain-containing protein n=1 Tax=Wenzhouxiangella sp. EGI_FJ10409 TaxID=3243767 RepID=UPI0035E0BD85